MDCLNNIRTLEENSIRFIAVTQSLDTDQQNPASRFLLHVLGAAAEFERALIRERTQAGQQRYKRDYAAGKVGKTVYSRSGRNLPPHRPRKIFNKGNRWSNCDDRESLSGGSQITWDWEVGTVFRTLQERSKSS